MSFKLRLPEVIKKTSEKLKLTLADQSFSKVLNFLEEWQPCNTELYSTILTLGLLHTKAKKKLA